MCVSLVLVAALVSCGDDDGGEAATDVETTETRPADDAEPDGAAAPDDPVSTVDVCSDPDSATIIGTEGPDDIDGTDEDDVIFGLGGDDVIRAHSGDDIVCAGPGDDRIGGGPGDDVLDGGEGLDSCMEGPGTNSTISCEG